MTDIEATERKYISCCVREGCSPHQYISDMLKKERKELFVETVAGGFCTNFSETLKTSMRLYLAGNNHILTSQRLQDIDAKMLYKTLQFNFYVAQLDLRYNNITDEGAIYIAELIKENEALLELNLMFNDFGEKGGKAIAKALEVNNVLQALRLTGCKIGDQGGMAFAQALQINKTLRALDLGETDMKTSSIVAMATVLHNNRSLKSLNVNRPITFTVQEEFAVHYANMLKVNTTLEELCMEKYEITDFGMTRICDNLTLNVSLTYLDLSNNRITRDGAKELGQLLRLNTPLKMIDLANNRIEDDGAVELAHAIATYNSHLTTLVVTSNNIGTTGLCCLADSLRYNCSITNIYIWGNHIEEPTCIAFANLLETKRLLEENVDVRAYVVDDVTHLAHLSHGVRVHYYWAPSYGDDVPSWQPRCHPSEHPRDPGIPLE